MIHFNSLSNFRWLATIILSITLGVCQMLGANDTVNISISSYATAKSWSNNTQYRTVTSGSVTITANDNGGKNTGSNTGKYISSDNSWRLYESERSYLTIDAGSGNELVSFKLTFSVDNNGTFSYGGSAIASNTAKNVASGNQSTSTGTIGHSKGSSAGKIYITAIQVVYASSCSNSVTINKGSSTNCSFTLSKSGAQASCDGVATTVSITPNTGYGSPEVSESGASSSPTISGSGNTQTVTYASNTTGTSAISVSCSANTYTITLDNESATTSGTADITATYNDDDNLDGTPAITVPAKTGWTFGGYYTAKQGGGTQIIAANGNVNASAGGGSTYTDGSKNWKYADNITLYAKWTCTVTWSVNKTTNVYDAQTVTYNSSGCKVGSVPSGSDLDLENDYCGDKFVGWTDDEDYVHGTSTLFTNVAGSPELKTVGDVTFYAVFADYDE